MTPTATHSIDAAVLVDALAAVLRCTSDDESVPVIGGVLLEPSSAGLRLVGTDKFRLAVWDLPAVSAGGHPFLLAGSELAVLLTGLAAEGTVVIEVNEDAVVFRHAEQSVAVPTLPGTYPEYRRLLDGNTTVGTITADRSELEQALLTAATTAPDAVRLEPTELGLRVGRRWPAPTSLVPIPVGPARLLSTDGTH